MADRPFDAEIIAASDHWRGCEEKLEKALAAAARAEGARGAISVLLGDDAAITALNKQFRGKDGPTNVLSFPPTGTAEAGFLGDIALAAETIGREADDQGKSFEDHAVHVVVHGFLHLLGYDHIDDAEAEEMEAREREILASLGISDPYG